MQTTSTPMRGARILTPLRRLAGYLGRRVAPTARPQPCRGAGRAERRRKWRDQWTPEAPHGDAA